MPLHPGILSAETCNDQMASQKIILESKIYTVEHRNEVVLFALLSKKSKHITTPIMRPYGVSLWRFKNRAGIFLVKEMLEIYVAVSLLRGLSPRK